MITDNKKFENIYQEDLRAYSIEKEVYDEFLDNKNEKGIRLFSGVLANSMFRLILSGYSSGQDFDTLKEYGKEMFERYLNSWKGANSYYFDIQKSYEIAILFDIPKEEVLKFNALQKSFDYKDKYLDLLVRYFDRDHVIATDTLRAFKMTTPLVEVIELAKTDTEKAVLRLQKYLDTQWLPMQQDGLITNKQHVDPKKFRGYWSIEAAALVKMLGLDDTILKGCEYYPEKLVDYKNTDYSFYREKIEPDTPKEVRYKKGIASFDTLEKIIAIPFHEQVENMVRDYKNVSESEFYKKYDLKNMWHTENDYSIARKETNFLGMLLIETLADAGYITSLDWKIDVTMCDIENFWGDEAVKLVQFDLQSDQCYYAYIPQSTNVDSIFDVKIYDVDSDCL